MNINTINDKGISNLAYIDNSEILKLLNEELKLVPQFNSLKDFLDITYSKLEPIVKNKSYTFIEDNTNSSEQNIKVSKLSKTSIPEIYSLFEELEYKIEPILFNSQEPINKSKTQSIDIETIDVTKDTKVSNLFDVFNFKITIDIKTPEEIVSHLLKIKKEEYLKATDELDKEEINEILPVIYYKCDPDKINDYIQIGEQLRDFQVQKLIKIINEKRFQVKLNETFFDYLLNNISDKNVQQNIKDLQSQYLRITNLNPHIETHQKRRIETTLKNVLNKNPKIHLDVSNEELINNIYSLFIDKKNYKLKYFPFCLNLKDNSSNINKTKQIFNNNSLSLEYNFHIQDKQYEKLQSAKLDLDKKSLEELLYWKNIKELVYLLMVLYEDPFEAFCKYLDLKSNNSIIDMDLLYNDNSNKHLFNDFFNKNNNNVIYSKGFFILNKLKSISKPHSFSSSLNLLISNYINYIANNDINDLFDYTGTDKNLIKSKLYNIEEHEYSINIKDLTHNTNLFDFINWHITFENEKEYKSNYKSDGIIELRTQESTFTNFDFNIDFNIEEIHSKYLNLSKTTNEYELLFLSLVYIYFKFQIKHNKINKCDLINIKHNFFSKFDNHYLFEKLNELFTFIQAVENVKINFNNNFIQNKYVLNIKQHKNSSFDNTLILDLSSYISSSLISNTFNREEELSSFKYILGKITTLTKLPKNKEYLIHNEELIFDKIEKEVNLSYIVSRLEDLNKTNNFKNIIFLANLTQEEILNINHPKKDQTNSNIFDYHLLHELIQNIRTFNPYVNFVPLVNNILNIYYYKDSFKVEHDKKMIILKDNIIQNHENEIGNFFPIFRMYDVVKNNNSNKTTEKSKIIDYNTKDKHKNFKIKQEDYENVYQYQKYKNGNNQQLKNILTYYTTIKEALLDFKQSKNKRFNQYIDFNKGNRKYEIPLLPYLNEIKEVLNKNELQ